MFSHLQVLCDLEESHLNFSEDEKSLEDDRSNYENTCNRESKGDFDCQKSDTAEDLNKDKENSDSTIKEDYKKIFTNIFNLIEKAKEYER